MTEKKEHEENKPLNEQKQVISFKITYFRNQ